MLKIAINKHQNHSIPAVWCMEIASHPISPYDCHFCLLSSSPSITRSDPWGHTLLSATVIQYKGSQSLATVIQYEGSQSVTWPPQSLVDLHCMSYYQYFVIISFQRLSICHHLYCSSALRCTPYTLKFLYFKFIFALSNLFHSFSHLIKFHYFTATLLTYKSSCILPYKNKKS